MREKVNGNPNGKLKDCINLTGISVYLCVFETVLQVGVGGTRNKIWCDKRNKE